MRKDEDTVGAPIADQDVWRRLPSRQRVSPHLPRSDRGSVSVFVVATSMMGFLLVVALVGIGQFVVARERVAAAAEAGALAAAPVTFRPFGAPGSAVAEAERLVRANGAELVRCDCSHSPRYHTRTATVTARLAVTVLGFQRIDLQYTAAAEFRPVDLIHRAAPNRGPSAR